MRCAVEGGVGEGKARSWVAEVNGRNRGFSAIRDSAKDLFSSSREAKVAIREEFEVDPGCGAVVAKTLRQEIAGRIGQKPSEISSGHGRASTRNQATTLSGLQQQLPQQQPKGGGGQFCKRRNLGRKNTPPTCVRSVQRLLVLGLSPFARNSSTAWVMETALEVPSCSGLRVGLQQ